MSVYAISDLHGYIDLYQQVKEFLKPDDKVYCLGDCCDRGPASWETIKAVACDSQWTYLLGNHEHMFTGAMCEYHDDSLLRIFENEYPRSGGMINLVNYNGGYDTLQKWIESGANPSWITYFLGLPKIEFYNNTQGLRIALTHAGFTPLSSPLSSNLLWDRNHFKDEWPTEGCDNLVVVHGHTPCDNFKEWDREGALWYANNHKVNIDMGTYRTGKVCLLDLDTFDEHIFETEVE